MQQAHIHPLDYAEITQALAPLLQMQSGQIKLFGSRARGDARLASDIDLALCSEARISPWLLAEARERLENSRIPFRVDLVEYATASPELKQAIDREGIPWTA